MDKNISLGVVICSFGRDEILLKCISSVARQNKINCQILIIDNNSCGLDELVLEKINSYNLIRIIHESKEGLSNARNRGINELNQDYILFLDDDVQLPEGFFDKVIATIESEQFDCFGGMYYPWYPQGKPAWLPVDFGKKTPLLADTGPIDVHKHGFLSAGIMCVKREAIEAVGGFRTDLGMTNSIGYGEEDDLQMRLQAAGYRLGFVPDWWLYHAVLEHKHNVSWHLKSAYAHARDGQRTNQKKSKKETLARLSLVLLTLIPKRIPIALYRLFFKSGFYWQNAILYMFNPVAECFGGVMGTKLVKKK